MVVAENIKGTWEYFLLSYLYTPQAHALAPAFKDSESTLVLCIDLQRLLVSPKLETGGCVSLR